MKLKKCAQKFSFIFAVLIGLLTLFVVFSNMSVKADEVPRVDDVYDFSYVGKEQTFTSPATGYYRLETWGAQGGRQTGATEANGYSSTIKGGYGGILQGRFI